MGEMGKMGKQEKERITSQAEEIFVEESKRACVGAACGAGAPLSALATGVPSRLGWFDVAGWVGPSCGFLVACGASKTWNCWKDHERGAPSDVVDWRAAKKVCTMPHQRTWQPRPPVRDDVFVSPPPKYLYLSVSRCGALVAGRGAEQAEIGQ